MPTPAATSTIAVCDSFMEAAWLAAFALVPLYVEMPSATPFEPAKVALLRGFAALALGAMVARCALDRSAWSELHRLGQSWVVRFWLVLLAVTALATVTSLLPERSLWGGWERRQGLITTGATTVLFLALAWRLRTPTQWARLRGVVIAAGVASALLALIARPEISSISLPAGWRLSGPAGNPIFLGAALLLPLFLAGERLVFAHRGRQHLATLTWGAILVFLAAVFLATQSRGPALAAAAGLVSAALVAPGAGRQRRALALGAAAVGALALALMAYSGSPPWIGLRDTPVVGRLLTSANLQHPTAQVRLEVWAGTARRWASPEPAFNADLQPDALAAVRRWLGWGPETLDRLFAPYMTPQLAQIHGWQTLADRAHNAALDALVTTGSLGLFATLALWTSTLLAGRAWLRQQSDRAARTLAIALLAALVACLVEWQVGIPTTATLLAFAGMSATVVAAPRFAVADAGSRSDRTVHGLLAALVLAGALVPLLAGGWWTRDALASTTSVLERAEEVVRRLALLRLGFIVFAVSLGVALLASRRDLGRRRGLAVGAVLAISVAVPASLLRLEDASAAARMQLGSLLQQVGDLENAQLVLDDAARRHPGHATLGFAAANLHVLRSLSLPEPAAAAHLRSAISGFGAVVAADPLDPSPWAARAEARLRLAGIARGRQAALGARAFEDARIATSLHPGWPLPRLLQARASALATGSSARE